MKSAKDRKMERKRKNKALSVAKTVKSRQRRLDNKAKRDEIHAIDPDIKVKVIDQVTYDEDGNKITVYNNALSITSSIVTPTVDEEMVAKIDKQKELHILMHGDQCICDVKIPTVEVFNTEIEEVEAVEVDDVGKFQKLVNKWRL